MKPVQLVGEVLTRRRVGDYHLLTLAAPGIAQRARPGQFVALAVGGRNSALLARRCFAIHATTPHGQYAGTVQFVVTVRGEGTRWLSELNAGDPVDVLGPLGTPFRLPDRPRRALLVGADYGSASMILLSGALLARECRVQLLLAGDTAARVFGELEAKRTGAMVTVLTADGTGGRRGTVADVLPGFLADADVVYGAGPMPVLRVVSALAADAGVRCEVALEETMVCGFGVCMSCTVPVLDDEHRTRMVRSCVEGPVFAADRVRWDLLDQRAPVTELATATTPGGH